MLFFKIERNDFEINLKTKEYYTSCIKCREYNNQFNIKNKDDINAQKRKHSKQIKRFGKTGKPMAGKQSRQIKRNNCM